MSLQNQNGSEHGKIVSIELKLHISVCRVSQMLGTDVVCEACLLKLFANVTFIETTETEKCTKNTLITFMDENKLF